MEFVSENYLFSCRFVHKLRRTMFFQLAVCLLYVTMVNAAVNAPTGFDRTSIRSTSFTLTWTEEADLDYQVTVQLSGRSYPASPSGATVSPGVTVTQTTSGDAIQPDTNYDVFLFAVSHSASSDFAFLKSLTTASAAPTISGFIDVGTNQFTFRWDYTNPAADFQQATQYRVTYSGGGSKQTESVANINTKMLRITELTSNTDYSVTVLAWKNDVISTDDSASSPVATFDKPTGLSATTVTTTSIEISWSAPDTTDGGSASIAGYVVSWTPTGSGGSSTMDVTGTSATIDNLQANTDYSITVAAKSANNGVGELSDALPATTLDKPTRLSATTVTSTSIEISWSAPDTTGGGSASIAAYVVSWTPASSGGSSTMDVTGTSATIDNLQANTDYSITVTAKSTNGGVGTLSDALSATTVPSKVNQPSNSSDATTSKIYLMWDAVSGTSPSLTYVLSWTSSGPSGSTTNLTTTSATISGLTASTRYSFTVTAVNDGGSADPSESSMFSTLPNQPDSPTLSRPFTNSTTQLNVEWNKPSGGYDIVDYVVDWWLSSSDGSMTSSGIVTGATISSYTIEGLTPGETYDVTVKARNSASAGQSSSSAHYTTNPNPVSYIAIEQSANEPDKILVLTWETPSGNGDNITIQYQSLTEHTMNTKSVEFEISQSSLSVVPGNNYTVTVTVHSKGYESTPESIDTNSKPAEPTFNVKAFTNELHINWAVPEGYYEGLTVYFNNSEIKVDNSGPYILTGLKPYTDYEVEMYAWITNSTGQLERSTSSPGTYKTLPGSPPSPVFNSSLSDNAESSVNTIIFVLPPKTFSEDNGPIQYYAVYLAFGDPSNPTPNVTNMRTCESLTSGDECVTLWTDGQGNLVQGNARQKTKRSVLTRQTGSIEFTIGDGSVTLSPWNVEYLNYPLQPDTGYRVAVAAKTGYEQMTATEFYPTIMTGGGSGPNTGLIVGLVFAALIAVIAIVGGIYYYRRRTFHKKGRSYGSNNNSIEISHNASPARSSRTYNTNTSITKSDCSRSIPTSQFDDYMIKTRENSYNRLTEEYEELKDVGVDQSTSEAIKSENYTKNRYKKNILPYDVTRVKLDMVGDEPGTDFIHANYIPGYNKEKEFIASQGPLPTTKEDFWRMIWEQNSRTIVMLTQIVEGERVKCDHYWPYNNEPVVMAGIAVKLVVESTSKDWVYREFMLSRDTEQRLVTQFHYTAWPDHGVPETAENLVKFVRYFQRQVSRETRDCGPMTVHCSAGVGRTGTFIAMDRLLQHMKDHDYVDIFGIVHEMRRHRMSMVQTDKQYILLHEMVQDVINEVYDTTDEVPVYENTVQSPIYENATFSGLHG
ncbi:receptor-type tyrosine-protein phosphatase H-like [Clavelina lepadiformis]|uniref:receptor-type tyrosine-protein phosphatase H-like n=1 Tax=Clavelina lepadiformis TaxID=159417 RepID=UPI00404179C2